MFDNFYGRPFVRETSLRKWLLTRVQEPIQFMCLVLARGTNRIITQGVCISKALCATRPHRRVRCNCLGFGEPRDGGKGERSVVCPPPGSAVQIVGKGVSMSLPESLAFQGLGAVRHGSPTSPRSRLGGSDRVEVGGGGAGRVRPAFRRSL